MKYGKFWFLGVVPALHLAHDVNDALSVQFGHTLRVVFASLVCHSHLHLLEQALQCRMQMRILNWSFGKEAPLQMNNTGMPPFPHPKHLHCNAHNSITPSPITEMVPRQAELH